MGASNAMKAFVHWPAKLTHRELAALVYMALVALDDDAPPRFFAEWQVLARAIGQDPDGNEELARRNTLKVLNALSRAGAIVSSGQARTGVRAEYALTLDPERTFRPIGRGREVQWEQVPRDSISVSKSDTQKLAGPSNLRVQIGHASVSKSVPAACPNRTDQRVQFGHPQERVQEEVQEQGQEGRGSLGNLSTEPADARHEMPLLETDSEIQADEKARKLLGALPDFGASRQEQVRATDPDLTDRQIRIRAAALSQQPRTAQPATGIEAHQ